MMILMKLIRVGKRLGNKIDLSASHDYLDDFLTEFLNLSITNTNLKAFEGTDEHQNA